MLYLLFPAQHFMPAHNLSLPSPWVERFAPLVPVGGRVLDVACGFGRHARLFAARGCRVEAVDRDAEAIATLKDATNISARQVDLEAAAWPFAEGEFDAIVVTNYLHRPLFEHLLIALNGSGVLIYETFMAGNERFGRPSSAEFLLQPGELLALCAGQLDVVAFEHGYVDFPKPAMLQRLAAVRPGFSGQRSI